MRKLFQRFRAWAYNRYVECHNTRLDNKKRYWMCYRIGGGGVVSLGKCNRDDAILKVSQFGTVRSVDDEVAAIFYSDNS